MDGSHPPTTIAPAAPMSRTTLPNHADHYDAKPGVARPEGDSREGTATRPIALTPRVAHGLDLPPLPIALAPFVGRERELATVQALLLRPEVRLLVLTGPGGVGKTRLALRTAEAVADRFADGAAFVALAPVADADSVLPAIARALDVREASDRSPAERLRAALRDRHLLLVLDNFEHVLAAGPAVADLLGRCPRLAVVVTSRAPLGVYGERDYPVPSLGLPDDPTDAHHPLPPTAIEQADAVRLFVDRVQAVRPDFALTEANAAAVAAICRHLDGLPLAIELAAARTRHFAPAALLARLERRLPLLTGGPRDQPPRLRTMRDAIAWSYDLLSRDEQALFRRLSVFVGGFTLEAAEAIAGGEGGGGAGLVPLSVATPPPPPERSDTPSVLDLVSSLVDKSLLRPADGPDDARAGPRFGMLETIREYGLERLDASGEGEEVRRRHAAFYLALAERVEPELVGREQRRWLARLEAEHGNLRAVLDWAIERGEAEIGLRLGSALWRFWYLRGHAREGERWLARLLDRIAAASPTMSVEALRRAGSLARLWGDEERGAALLERSLQLARATADKREIGRALHHVGNAIAQAGDVGRARTLLEESLTLAREAGDRIFVVLALGSLGEHVRVLGDFPRAAALLTEALDLARATGDELQVSFNLVNLATLRRAEGDLVRSSALYREALALAGELGNQESIAYGLAGLGGVAGDQGRWEQAARLLGACAALCEEIGLTLQPDERVRFERDTAAARHRLGAAAFAAAWDASRALPLEHAVAEAMVVASDANSAAPARPSSDAGLGLSPREREVLRLVAEGLGDKEIAAALAISPRTVGRHLENLRAKLGVDSRAAAAALAVRQGLV